MPATNRINSRKRYLVLSSGNEVINPEDHAALADGLALDLQSEGSPSHKSFESAKAFAGALAAANLGKRFYIVATLAAVATQVCPPVAPADAWVECNTLGT